MPYLSTLERRAEERGREKGIQSTLLESISEGLRSKFPDQCEEVLAKIRELQDIDQLKAIQKRLWTAESVQALQELV